MKILIATPSSDIGRRVLSELIAPEFSVRVVMPDPARLPDDIRHCVEIVDGFHDDPETLRRALSGVEALFWNGPIPAPALRSIREAGTRRIVIVSTPEEVPAPIDTMNDVVDNVLRHLARNDWSGIATVPAFEPANLP